MSYMERPSWQAYFTTLVQHVSTRSPCNRLKVGCLIVRDNRIISQGYNGFLPGLPHTSVVVDNHEIATIHAEQNALTDCAKRGVSCDKSVAYITHYPCLNCAKLLYSAGIKDIYYIEDYKNSSQLRDIGLFHKEGMSITKLTP
ncbi:deoxycytidylate deaminase domain-containing protein [Organic Lake phycodnavirus 2]|nr:deoxycytidylate deaminase domain-containing protein [Organic Lake phycodnavirus 2]